MNNQTIKSFFTILLTIIFIQGYSQPWNPKTAYWIYDPHYNPYKAHLRVSYLKDTVVNGKECQLLKKDMNLYNYVSKTYSYVILDKEVTYYESGVTYILNNHQFDTLYYFSGKINDRYTITDRLKCSPDDKGYAVIKDTGLVIINNHKLKWQAVDYFFERLGNQYTLRDTIIEKIGATKCYFLLWDYAKGKVGSNEGGPLKCFRDTILGIYSTTLSTDCEFDLRLDYPKVWMQTRAQEPKSTWSVNAILAHYDRVKGNELDLGDIGYNINPGLEILYNHHLQSFVSFSSGISYQFVYLLSHVETSDRFRVGEISIPVLLTLKGRSSPMSVSTGIYGGRFLHLDWDQKLHSQWVTVNPKYREFYSDNGFFMDAYLDLAYTHKGLRIAPFIRYRFIDNWMEHFRTSVYYGVKFGFSSFKRND